MYPATAATITTNVAIAATICLRTAWSKSAIVNGSPILVESPQKLLYDTTSGRIRSATYPLFHTTT